MQSIAVSIAVHGVLTVNLHTRVDYCAHRELSHRFLYNTTAMMMTGMMMTKATPATAAIAITRAVLSFSSNTNNVRNLTISDSCNVSFDVHC